MAAPAFFSGAAATAAARPPPSPRPMVREGVSLPLGDRPAVFRPQYFIRVNCMIFRERLRCRPPPLPPSRTPALSLAPSVLPPPPARRAFFMLSFLPPTFYRTFSHFSPFKFHSTRTRFDVYICAFSGRPFGRACTSGEFSRKLSKGRGELFFIIYVRPGEV